MDFADVVVAGAGPAGSAAAAALASAGVSVVVLERSRWPRAKPCGGLVPSAVLEQVGRLEFARYAVHRAVVSRQSRSLAFELPATGAVVVDRGELDEALLSKALSLGARFHAGRPITGIALTGDRAEVSYPGGSISAQLVIGADGASGGVARLAGLRDGWRPWELASALVRTVETTGEWDAVEFRLIPVLFGMGWVFPLGHGRLNVGVAGHYRVRAYLKPWLNYITQSVRGTPASSDRAWILPAGGLPRRFAGGRVLLAGDAAGFVSPLTGEGIRYAVESGAIAGKLALNAFCSGSLASLPRVYTRVCNREIVPDFRGDLWRSVLWGKRQLVPLKTIAREFYNKLARTADSPFGAAL